MSNVIKKVRVSGKSFTDESGKPFVPFGINMVCKDKERNYIGDYSEADFRFLREKGFNLIRLGLQWAACEPVPGEYSSEYFEAMDKIIEMAANEDIPVFLDMHQDLYGVKFEDGAPLWATIDEGYDHVRTGLWSESYLVSPAVQAAFDNFWADAKAPDGTGVRTHFINLWKYIAKRYADNPYVVAYDVLNEPFPGSAGVKVAMILSEFAGESGDLSVLSDEGAITELIGRILPVTKKFEEETLNPFYDQIARAVRSVDPETVFLFESNYFANAGIPSFVRPALDESGNVIKNQAYAPHGYDILVDTEEYEQGGFERVDLIFGSLLSKAASLDVPCFIGEWGCYPDASKAQKEQAEHLLNTFKKAGVGQTYFDYSHIHDGGIIKVFENFCSKNL